MKKTVSVVIVDKGHLAFTGEVAFQGMYFEVVGMTEQEIKNLARLKLIEEDELKEYNEIIWEIKWN